MKRPSHAHRETLHFSAPESLRLYCRDSSFLLWVPTPAPQHIICKNREIWGNHGSTKLNMSRMRPVKILSNFTPTLLFFFFLVLARTQCVRWQGGDTEHSLAGLRLVHVLDATQFREVQKLERSSFINPSGRDYMNRKVSCPSHVIFILNTK